MIILFEGNQDCLLSFYLKGLRRVLVTPGNPVLKESRQLVAILALDLHFAAPLSPSSARPTGVKQSAGTLTWPLTATVSGRIAAVLNLWVATLGWGGRIAEVV